MRDTQWTASATDTSVANGSSRTALPSRRFRLGVIPLTVLCVLYVVIFVHRAWGRPGVDYGIDYGVYDSAATLLRNGHNPYDHQALVRVNRKLLAAERAHPKADDLTRVGEPPVMFWLMQPLTAIPFGVAVPLWMAALLVLGGIGTLAALLASGWSGPQLALGVVLASPPFLLYAYYGNLAPAIAAALGAGAWLGRRFSFSAGILLSAAWIKPQFALPLAGLILLFHSASPRRALAGFALGTVGGFLASVLAAGLASLRWQTQAAFAFQHALPMRFGLATASEVEALWLPGRWLPVISTLCLAGGVILTGWTWERMRGASRPVPLFRLAWLWALWFVLAPYGHFDDLVFLVAPVAAMVHCPGTRGVALCAAYCAVLTVILQGLLSPLTFAVPLLLLGGGAKAERCAEATCCLSS